MRRRRQIDNKTQRQRDRVQIRAGAQLQQAESNQLAHSQREAWHSSPTKGDSTINSINPISIPSSSPHWVNTHLHHTAKLLLPSSICKESGEQRGVQGGWINRSPDSGTFPCSTRTVVTGQPRQTASVNDSNADRSGRV